MKPVYHPAVSDITVEGILYALSDPVRVQIYAEIESSECPQTCSTFLKLGNRTLPKSTLSQHFNAFARVQSVSKRGARAVTASSSRSRRNRALASLESLVIVSFGVTGWSIMRLQSSLSRIAFMVS